MQIRFDHGPDGLACQFDNPKRLIIADTAGDMNAALEKVDQALTDGQWVAGYLTYEAGYALESKLAASMPSDRKLPLVCFGVYDAPRSAPALPVGIVDIGSIKPLWDRHDYAKAFRVVHDYICAGDIYQANLTFPVTTRCTGSAEMIYAALAQTQPVHYGALVLQDGLPDILSRSPERFFGTDQNGRIETRPMKGTQPRSADPAEDARNRIFLQTDPKNRAENLMIVDLLRNDVSRVSQPGSVCVPELFSVETYETVHQMTSLIRAQLIPGTSLGDIFRALFPCGSITGAPKIRAMEILAEQEPYPRDIYCGSIGWAAPDGRSEFNVAIRTLMLNETHAQLNVGGGVVYDSTSANEYEEALWKARFLTNFIDRL